MVFQPIGRHGSSVTRQASRHVGRTASLTTIAESYPAARMTLDPDRVRHAIADYLARYGETEHEVALLARRFSVLPLYPDWTGFIGLAPAGDLLWIEYEGENPPQNADVTEYARWRAGIRHLAALLSTRRRQGRISTRLLPRRRAPAYLRRNGLAERKRLKRLRRRLGPL